MDGPFRITCGISANSRLRTGVAAGSNGILDPSSTLSKPNYFFYNKLRERQSGLAQQFACIRHMLIITIQEPVSLSANLIVGGIATPAA